jgi:hypothetical protein
MGNNDVKNIGPYTWCIVATRLVVQRENAPFLRRYVIIYSEGLPSNHVINVIR